MLNRIKLILWENRLVGKEPSTQAALSEICGVAQPEISRISNGKKRKIELETAIKIARGLGKPVEYVFPDY